MVKVDDLTVNDGFNMVKVKGSMMMVMVTCVVNDGLISG